MCTAAPHWRHTDCPEALALTSGLIGIDHIASGARTRSVSPLNGNYLVGNFWTNEFFEGLLDDRSGKFGPLEL